MIVVDTNVIACFWLEGQFSDQAEKAFQKDPDWVAPLLWKSEFASILAGYLRRGDLDIKQALQIIEKAQGQFQDKEFTVDFSDVLSLVDTSTCSSYDCEFVALAKSLNVPLITVDKLILKNFPDVSFSLKNYLGALEG